MIFSRICNSYGVSRCPPPSPPPFGNCSFKKVLKWPTQFLLRSLHWGSKDHVAEESNSGKLPQAEALICSNAKSEKEDFLLRPEICARCTSLSHSEITRKWGKVSVLHILASHSATARRTEHNRKNQWISWRKIVFPSSRLCCLWEVLFLVVLMNTWLQRPHKTIVKTIYSPFSYFHSRAMQTYGSLLWEGKISGIRANTWNSLYSIEKTSVFRQNNATLNGRSWLGTICFKSWSSISLLLKKKLTIF